MTTSERDPVLVIVQLVGGNDFMNTVIPYTNPLYHDARPGLAFSQEEVLPIDDTLAFNPHAAPLKDMYDAGKMAVVQGSGTRTPAGRTSAARTSGTRASRIPSSPRAGWDRPSARWTPTRRTP